MSEAEETWLPVIGRALAHLCMKADAGDEDRTMLQKAQFLEGLGLSRSDAAAMLGTTAASISELNRQARTKKTKGSKDGPAKKESQRGR